MLSASLRKGDGHTISTRKACEAPLALGASHALPVFVGGLLFAHDPAKHATHSPFWNAIYSPSVVPCARGPGGKYLYNPRSVSRDAVLRQTQKGRFSNSTRKNTRRSPMGFREADRQLIIQFLSGTGDDVIWRGTNALESRAAQEGLKSHTVTVRNWDAPRANRRAAQLMMRTVPKLTASSRIYLRGHGNWKMQTIGGVSAEDVANILGAWGLPNGILISITGCELGRDLSSATYGHLGNSVDSFASKVHRLLKEDYEVDSVVFARVYVTETVRSGSVNDVEKVGFKTHYTSDPDLYKACPWTVGWDYQSRKSKVCYWWQGGKQVRGWWNYKQNVVNLIR
jgi:hypothetical protein